MKKKVVGRRRDKDWVWGRWGWMNWLPHSVCQLVIDGLLSCKMWWEEGMVILSSKYSCMELAQGAVSATAVYNDDGGIALYSLVHPFPVLLRSVKPHSCTSDLWSIQ